MATKLRSHIPRYFEQDKAAPESPSRGCATETESLSWKMGRIERIQIAFTGRGPIQIRLRFAGYALEDRRGEAYNLNGNT
ncbi:hypothetical protein EVAR_69533_1 [Eumeta japonica]|uniref:Uncharacterized protein n=1 Tax=Eumeta variegata TaxID=151549 RepID=A0A4C1SMY1_EUMVA|nr:hypothetical protein EVAR_69533_1 [Eumeta japonica]